MPHNPEVREGHTLASTHRGYIAGCPDCRRTHTVRIVPITPAVTRARPPANRKPRIIDGRYWLATAVFGLLLWIAVFAAGYGLYLILAHATANR